MGATKLFCFPYAGGSAAMFNKWKDYLDESIELYPIEMSGRGKRYGEPFYQSVDEVVDEILNMFEKCFIECPCAFFGHSMGGVIAFELSHAVRSRINSANPVHLFVSGRYPPHLKGSGVIMHKLTDAEFKAEILKLGGVPKEVFENQDMMDIFLPILKADYKIVETYSYAKKENRLECGITVLNGEQDIAVPTDVMVRWREYTCREFNLYNLAGGHFFIHNNIERITEIINGALTGRM